MLHDEYFKNSLCRPWRESKFDPKARFVAEGDNHAENKYLDSQTDAKMWMPEVKVVVGSIDYLSLLTNQAAAAEI